MDILNQIARTNPPLPVPDPSYLSGLYTGWGIWIDPAETTEDIDFSTDELDLGLMLSESGINTRRLILIGTIFSVLGPGTMTLSYVFPEAVVFFILLGVLFLGIAFYQMARLFINKDLRLRIFREGFSLRRWEETMVVRWQDVNSVLDKWQKMVIQGIIHIHTHRITMTLEGGKELILDRRLQEIERISRQIQNAVTQARFPGIVEQLKKGETIPFGSFSLNRHGLAYGRKKALPWKELKQLEVRRHGEASVSIHKTGQRKLSFPWVTEKGAKIPNLQLFILLGDWFLAAAALAEEPRSQESVPSEPPQKQVTESEYIYSLVIPKKSAVKGMEMTLYVGSTKSEKRLILPIPPGVESGKHYRYPGYGPDDPASGKPTTLLIEVLVEKETPFQKHFKEIKITSGIILILMGLLWLSFFSAWSFFPRIILASIVGGTGGALMAEGRSRLGLICGVIGGAVSLLLQEVYYIVNYLQFGRDSFWNYETVLLLMVSLLPGIGLYYLLFKRKR